MRQLMCTMLAASLIACSSTGGGGTTTAAVPVSVVAQGTTGGSAMPGMRIVDVNTGQKTTFAATRDAVWARVIAAYDTLGLPISFKDDARYSIGNDQIKARRAIRKVQLRDAVDCGSDLNGEKAETYEIRLSIQTAVAAMPDGSSELTTTVSSVGKSPTFSNSEINCPTKGAFEREIVKFVRKGLGLADR
jgi:hypothetical protein